MLHLPFYLVVYLVRLNSQILHLWKEIIMVFTSIVRTKRDSTGKVANQFLNKCRLLV